MSSPFARSNAAHAAQADWATVEKPEELASGWPAAVRVRLQATRNQARERGAWPYGVYSPLPAPCWTVAEAHSHTQQRVYLMLQAIGMAKVASAEARRLGGGMAQVRGTQMDKPYDFLVAASLGAVAALCGMPASTVRDALGQLAAKHSVIPMTVRTRGDSRQATVWRVPHWDDVLAARTADTQIASTHGGKVQWTNGRANSRRLLTPEQASVWRLGELPEREARQRTSAEEHAAPVDRPREWAAGSKLARPGIDVPKAVQQGLDELCGGPCDLAEAIVVNLRATAARHEHEFPDEMVVETCGWFIERVRDRRKRDVLHIKSSPAAYLRHVTRDDHDTTGTNWKTVMRGVDVWLGRRLKDELRAYESCHQCLELLHKTPGDKQILQFRDDMMRLSPVAFAKARTAFEAKHPAGGAEAKGTRREVGKPARSFSDALATGFVAGDEPPPKSA